MLDLDDLPPGTLCRTPSGRIGIVIKHQGAESKRDHFQRVVLRFNADPRDSVQLQPHILERITPCTRDRALTPEARAFWESPEGEKLMHKLRTRQQFTEPERETLERVLRGEPYRPPVSEVSKRQSGAGMSLALVV
jgi:hypothetical protein